MNPVTSSALSERMNAPSRVLRPSRDGVIAVYLAYLALILQTLARAPIRDLFPWSLGLVLANLVLFTTVLWRSRVRSGLLHLYFGLQSAIVLALLWLHPQFDFVTGLFALLCFHAALVFTGRVRWIWVGILIALIPGSLMFYWGVIQGLARSSIPVAVGIILPAYAIVSHEIEVARAKSQAMLAELQDTHRQLRSHVDQVEELAAMEERNRLARELHDSVSQTMFSIALDTRSAQILLERDPARVRPQLEQLQGLTQSALADMRSLIGQLRSESD
jgi:signal transduction histidine kinase